MKFGPVPLAQAEGAILAHSEHAGGRKIAKGTRLEQAHLDQLAAAGFAQVVVARLDPGDVHENTAALQLAQALVAGQGLRLSDAATGRVNLRAELPGVLEIDAAAIGALNHVHPGITVATVPQWGKLGPRGLAATIKIIPYAVPGGALDQACMAGAGALRLRAPVMRHATLIETRTGPDIPPEKGRQATEARLEFFGVTLAPRVVVPHEVDAVAAALAEAQGDLALILTGSATSDMADTAPEAVRRAGGQVHHYGMPVDPGNLLFLGEADGRPVVGLPGCARSAALNGADWVLERLICGVTVTPEDIMGMGVGGLLKDIPTRPVPRHLVDG
ncbi:molybdopterin biosynthesis protein [Aliishimia ponticola]|uniref:Molybdopterin biosynthesis protein n=1 Tax=Aliishimia ponticola TaxID=2499833 RepID=A0A4V3XKU8_9RHOB|nr:molybdopterin-binding protein [Aliishimia ponticola]THH38363.1 molybdopterin biosynthesis protein [Aliishimia ponticola]